jgi:transcriptional regulator with GAF, ATPase, and Fis domain
MSQLATNLADTGLEVLDLQTEYSLACRPLQVRDATRQMEGIQRLAHAFVERPQTMLQELVDTAIEICGAESAGISIQKKDECGEIHYHWVATAGKYGRFLNASLPPFPSACGVCIERGGPQLFRISKTFFDIMGIEAEIVTDGLLLPWQVDETHGTVWIISHSKENAFDSADCHTMRALSDFAAMAVRQQRQQQALMDQTSASAAAGMANMLAHKINNPLQSLTNLVYLAAELPEEMGARELASEMSGDLERLSGLVKELLKLPVPTPAKR